MSLRIKQCWLSSHTGYKSLFISHFQFRAWSIIFSINARNDIIFSNLAAIHITLAILILPWHWSPFEFHFTASLQISVRDLHWLAMASIGTLIWRLNFRSCMIEILSTLCFLFSLPIKPPAPGLKLYKHPPYIGLVFDIRRLNNGTLCVKYTGAKSLSF